MSEQPKETTPAAFDPAGWLGEDWGFTKADAELAAQIANDVAEQIDNRDTRAQLRMAVMYWNTAFCNQARLRREAESTVEIFRQAKALMDVVIPPNSDYPTGKA